MAVAGRGDTRARVAAVLGGSAKGIAMFAKMKQQNRMSPVITSPCQADKVPGATLTPGHGEGHSCNHPQLSPLGAARGWQLHPSSHLLSFQGLSRRRETALFWFVACQWSPSTVPAPSPPGVMQRTLEKYLRSSCQSHHSLQRLQGGLRFKQKCPEELPKCGFLWHRGSGSGGGKGLPRLPWQRSWGFQSHSSFLLPAG